MCQIWYCSKQLTVILPSSTCGFQTRVGTTYPGRRRSCPWPGNSCCSPHTQFCRRLPGWPTSRRWRSAGFLQPELPRSGRPGIWFPEDERTHEHFGVLFFIFSWQRLKRRESVAINIPVRALWWFLGRRSTSPRSICQAGCPVARRWVPTPAAQREGF